jgi:hypothetical protein
MSYLKTSPEQFLEYQELTRLKRFIFDDGIQSYLKKGSVKYGIIKNEFAGVSYFKCGVDSTILKTILLEDGFAFDENANLLVGKGISGITIPTVTDWYWVKIKYKQSTLEEGNVSISASGLVNGVGTKFTDILRGVPNHPTKIRFYNAEGTALAPLNGAVDYTVGQVVSDTVILLNTVGATNTLPLQNETNLRYSVVGTFTPASIQTPDQEEIYLYDSVNVSLVLETTLNTPPVFGVGENANNTFWVARVSKSVSNVFVQDKRSAFWQTVDGFALNKIDTTLNNVIGVENVKFQGALSTRDRNNVQIGWGLRTQDWSFDANTLEITLLSAVGGNVKSISQTQGQNRSFTGWRLYIQGSEIYCKVVGNSYPTSTSLRLTLDVANPDLFTIGEFVYLVPDVEEIEILAISTSGQTVEKETFVFPIADAFGKIELLVNGATYQYEFSYRYKNNFAHIPYYILPDTSTVGYATQYYNENQFDANGDLIIAPALTTYTGGLVTLNLAPNAYSIVVGSLQTGEIRGVNYTTVSNSVPFRDVVVGVDKQYQIFENPTVTLSAINYINLKSTDVNNITVKEGSTFWFHFKQTISLSGFDVRIKEDSLIGNPNGTGTLLYEFSDFDAVSSGTEDGVLLKFVFDGANWIYQKFHNIETTAWIPVTGINSGYDNGGDAFPLISENLHYRRFGEIIQFKGELYTNVSIPTSLAFNIPVGFRPAINRSIQKVIIGSATDVRFLLMDFQANGDVRLEQIPIIGLAPATSVYISFNGVYYAL